MLSCKPDGCLYTVLASIPTGVTLRRIATLGEMETHRAVRVLDISERVFGADLKSLDNFGAF